MITGTLLTGTKKSEFGGYIQLKVLNAALF